MSFGDDVERVKKSIGDIFERRRVAVYALCLAYAGYALRNFQARQPATVGSRGRYWVNRTGQAAARMFTRAGKSGSVLWWRMSHGVPYGIYLERANNRRNQAIMPTVEKFATLFYAALYGLYTSGQTQQGGIE